MGKQNKSEESGREKSKRAYTFVDLFCGMGGWSYGLQQQGFKHSLGVDDCSDTPQIANVYRQNIGAFHQEDIRHCDLSHLRGTIDVLVGSPPCKSFSVANTRSRTNNTEMMDEFMRIVNEIKPKVWVMENVSHALKYFTAPYQYKVDCNELGLPQTRVRGIWSNIPLDFQPVRKTYLNPNQIYRISRYNLERSGIRPMFGTITCSMTKAPNWHDNYVIEKKRGIRELTTEEALTLQSFPPWYKMSGVRSADGIMIGNAVPPLLTYRVGEGIRKYLTSHRQD